MRPRSDLNLRVRSLLADGPLTMAQIARALDKRSSDVRDVVKDLVKHEWVVNLNPNPGNIPARKHPGLYQLTDRCDTHIAPASKPAPIARALDKKRVVKLNPNPGNIPARKRDTHIASASKPAPRRSVNPLPLHDLWFNSQSHKECTNV